MAREGIDRARPQTYATANSRRVCLPKKWSAKALEPVEEPPADATYKDKQYYKRECIELEKRLAFNKRLAEQKQTWWRDKLNEYFELITGSMERTQPGLREVLRERYHCGDWRATWPQLISKPWPAWLPARSNSPKAVPRIPGGRHLDIPSLHMGGPENIL